MYAVQSRGTITMFCCHRRCASVHFENDHYCYCAILCTLYACCVVLFSTSIGIEIRAATKIFAICHLARIFLAENMRFFLLNMYTCWLNFSYMRYFERWNANWSIQYLQRAYIFLSEWASFSLPYIFTHSFSRIILPEKFIQIFALIIGLFWIPILLNKFDGWNHRIHMSHLLQPDITKLDRILIEFYGDEFSYMWQIYESAQNPIGIRSNLVMSDEIIYVSLSTTRAHKIFWSWERYEITNAKIEQEKSWKNESQTENAIRNKMFLKFSFSQWSENKQP